MATREQRQKGIELLEKEFGEANGIYLTNYSGIDVEKITKLRRNLRGVGAKYIVVKNTLASIACERSGKAILKEHMKGPVGVAFSKDDPIGPARVIRDFNKEYKDLLGVKAAYVDGAVFNQQQAVALADLPSREVLLSQLLSCLKAPMSNLVGSLAGIMTKFVGTLEAVRKQKEEAGA